ncbi:MAG: SDR family oxidoreductase [Candidatus Parcubacteria bacterium]|nr:SDR family oxidoreductase [Burkholderiales bacterium]
MTGASTGIGEALARHYASAAGSESAIGLYARRRDLLEKLASGLPGRTALYAADVTDARAIAEAARDFMARFGTPDLVIANAGISVGTLGDEAGDIDKLRRILEVNVTALAATLAAFAPAMRGAGHGTLCGIASVAGFRGIPGAGAYSSSKAAAISWLESLRVELAGSGVSVVTICPGYIDTPMTQVNTYRMPFLLSADEAAKRFARAIEAKRRLAVIPWQMAAASALLRAMPGWLYDRIAARAPRKPRDVQI